jgi:hypothetical protein
MSPERYGVATADQRDQAAEDRDEAAWVRDRASATRDTEATERDGRAEARMLAAVQYVTLTRRLLDAAGQRDGREPGADQPVVHGLLTHLEEALQDAEGDRQAASRDRRAAAADRHQAAEDRFIEAAHRGQAAIERAQQAPQPALADHGRWSELYAWAQDTRAHAGALCQKRS